MTMLCLAEGLNENACKKSCLPTPPSGPSKRRKINFFTRFSTKAMKFAGYCVVFWKMGLRRSLDTRMLFGWMQRLVASFSKVLTSLMTFS
jgi:hypothetical protein